MTREEGRGTLEESVGKGRAFLNSVGEDVDDAVEGRGTLEESVEKGGAFLTSVGEDVDDAVEGVKLLFGQVSAGEDVIDVYQQRFGVFFVF